VNLNLNSKNLNLARYDDCQQKLKITGRGSAHYCGTQGRYDLLAHNPGKPTGSVGERMRIFNACKGIQSPRRFKKLFIVFVFGKPTSCSDWKQSESKLERELHASNLRPMPDQGCGKHTPRTCFFTDEFAVFSYIKMYSLRKATKKGYALFCEGCTEYSCAMRLPTKLLANSCRFQFRTCR